GGWATGCAVSCPVSSPATVTNNSLPICSSRRPPIRARRARQVPMPDAMQLYCDFLAGQSGTCIFTGEDGCHAFVTEDEIEATFGSRHDGKHFAWLDRKPGEVGPEGLGFLSDDHIDILLAENRIAF